MRRTRLAILVLALVAAAYPVAAFQTPPGFYEGFCPPVDYKFLKPPPGAKAGTPPAAGHAAIKVIHDSSGRSIVSPGYVATLDDNPQAQLSFVPDAFQLPAGGSSEVIDIKPVADYPPAPGITVTTNVYLITSSTPITKPSNLRLLYSTLLPAPSSIYVAQQDGGWQPLVSSASTSTGCSDISTQVTSVGYFMAGYPAGSTSGGGGGTHIGGGQALPIVVALAILIVVLAGIPLAVLRRRQAGAAESPQPEARQGRRRRNRRP